MNRIVVNFAPTGMIPKKEHTPYVPISSNEIIEDVHKAWEAGITLVHLHIRDEVTESPDYKKENFGKIINGIRKFAPELIICTSTSGRRFNEFEKRSDVLELEGDLKPDMGSLTLSSMNFMNQASMNEPDMVIKLAEKMLEKGIKPELEAFDTGMINYSKYLIKKGILKPPYYFNILFGNIATVQPGLLHAGIMVNDLPEDSMVSFGAFSDWQLPVNSAAIAMGYGVRVGIEDNIWFDRERTRLAENSMLINRIKDIVKLQGSEIMTSGELRQILKLKKGFGQYGTAD